MVIRTLLGALVLEPFIRHVRETPLVQWLSPVLPWSKLLSRQLLRMTLLILALAPQCKVTAIMGLTQMMVIMLSGPLNPWRLMHLNLSLAQSQVGLAQRMLGLAQRVLGLAHSSLSLAQRVVCLAHTT